MVWACSANLFYDNCRSTIEDSGNDSNLFGLDSSGKIVKKITITNASNIDWEDLTSDAQGNIYIGDFGNNNEKREHFRILKINHNDLDSETAEAEIIDFTVPKKKYSKDFEAFSFRSGRRSKRIKES